MSAPVSNPNSNTFRAEPFVNLTAESVSNGTGAAASGSNSRRASQIFSTADPVEFREMMVQDEQDELMDDDDDEELDETGISRRGSSTSRIRTRLPNHNNGGRLSISSGPHIHAASSISDLQRASIASTTSSTSSARRSSYDPNEPGVLEKIHTGQGKSKRKPISVQQWKHMTTFKIRPPTAAEAASSSATNTSVATPISVDPFQQYSPPLSITPDRKVESEAGFVFIPEGHSANAVPAAPPIPRTVPIVMPPTTLNQAPTPASLTKPVRKRARREEPNDPNIQVFYHDDVAAVPAIKRTESLDTPPTPPRPHHPTMDTLPLAPDNSTSAEPLVTALAPRLASPPPLAPPTISMQQTVSAPPTQQTPLAIKYDSAEQVFILPEMEPLERGGPPPKKWTPVYREMKTIGGGSWHTTTWISEGEPAVPLSCPPGFIPSPYSSGVGGGAVLSGAGNSLQGLSALSALALGSGSLIGSATPTLATPGGLAPAKRIKKVKSDASIGGGLAGGTSSTGGGRKRPSGAATTTTAKKGKKVTGTVTPAIMEPPLVAITRAVSDTEMRDA